MLFNDRATANNCYRVAACLREADLRELRTIYGDQRPPHWALEGSVRISRFSGALSWDTSSISAPLLVYGCADGPMGTGRCWMMGTTYLAHRKLAVFRFAREEIARWLKHYDRIENWVDGRNTLHVRWLKTLGFNFGSTIRFGGAPFQHFWRNRGE